MRPRPWWKTLEEGSPVSRATPVGQTCRTGLLVAAALLCAPLAADELVPTLHIVSGSTDSTRGVDAADLDGDGDVDVAAANLARNEVAWYENTGAGAYSPPSFGERIIATDRRSSSFVMCVDMNGDGRVDIISSSVNDDEVTWYENDGGSPPSFATAHVVTVDPNQDWAVPPEGFADAVRMIDVADFDGDGDLDVCSASVDDDRVAWFENPGPPDGTWTPTALTDSLDGSRAIHAADLDGDGDPDIVAGGWYDTRLLWFENTGGTPPVFVQRVVADFAPIQGGIWSIKSADFDGDGDLDPAVMRRLDGVEWYENDGASPPSFARRVIDPASAEGKEIAVADLDRDGDADIVAAERGNDRISWHENLGGAPPAFLERVLDEDPDGPGPQEGQANGARTVVTGDVDGDGDRDVVWGARDNDRIGWVELEPVVAASAADVDGDGTVGPGDLALVLGAWGSKASGPPDLDGDGTVGIGDLLAVLSEWGAGGP
jgi:hypothetical protein